MENVPSRPTDSHEEAAYDEFPYTSHAFAATQPARIAAVAELLGIAAPAVRTARVLELGCAAGGNLIPLAVRYPQAQFLGIEISGRQVAEGTARIKALGLTNIKLAKQNLIDFAGGSFDYIIAHGVLSWVPPDVQAAVLRIAGGSLAPNGLFLMSYNVLPGALLRAPLRDIMMRTTSTLTDPSEKVRVGREIVQRIARYGESTYGSGFSREVANMANRETYYVLHEHLGQSNYAWYVKDIIAKMQAVNLAYVAESEPWLSVPEAFSTEISTAVRSLGGDSQEKIEQYLDYFLARRFRSSIFTHPTNLRARHPAITQASFAKIYFGITTPFAVSPPPAPSMARFESRLVRYNLRGAFFEVRSALQARLVAVLEERRMQSCGSWSLEELFAALSPEPLTSAQQREIIDCLAELFLAQRLHIIADKPIVSHIREKPEVFAYARLDARDKRTFTANLHHESVPLAMPEMQYFLPLCDGTRTPAEISAILAEGVAAGDIPNFVTGGGSMHDWVQRELQKCVHAKLLVNPTSS